ncbi:sulfur carrier protein ThiS [Thermobifida fusca]|uniref:Thiamine biosynthesis protein ThiS n=2 Tax=Thermobifida fusca TaxID=2021 RepID=A0A9P2TBD1_THEFU|nr:MULTISPECIES: sulfur carrier protein ThiS [Thermobifida]AAZ55081.1 ThiS, thiamine-biosynthesis [Thermobifida fusca YX]EOR71773.1 thiamine biosynthesis protein ThiS [Thermobifida fusca TM51]MBO2528845.1 thiamine biosynthesis protein ThiS [Thermobifida sp.]MDD6793351.1 sulfur carrier protein ThiS [Thermobifida fusca]PPS96086.1 thiamine biosynthesis protein ThiS [Thermobifida fusca]
MNAIINGEPRQLAPDTTVADVVRSLTRAESGVAVAVNDEVVPKTDWARTVVSPDDRVDVLTAVQGG